MTSHRPITEHREKGGGHICAGSRQGEQADGRVGQTWPIRWKGAEAQECGNICTRRAYRHCAPSLDTPRHDRLLLFPHLKHTTLVLQAEGKRPLPLDIFGDLYKKKKRKKKKEKKGGGGGGGGSNKKLASKPVLHLMTVNQFDQPV